MANEILTNSIFVNNEILTNSIFVNKAILIIRVSTDQQSYEEQKKELINMAIADGYSQSQLVIIENKESAIKLDEEHREGIIDMKAAIENDNSINCVYIWEVSRWARKKYILFNLQHYLLERKIQLKVKNPSIILLDEHGNLNPNADWMFTIYAQLAETEMSLKLERFKRAKRERKREGYKAFKTLSFGYTTDANKKIIVDEERAELVRKIFKLYHTHSVSQIVEEVAKLGYKFSGKNIRDMLHNKAYISQATDKNGLPISYPRILSDETFNEIQEMMRINIKSNKTKRYDLCTRLIVCPECGAHYQVNGRKYRCTNRTKKYNISTTTHCHSDIGLSISYMDSLALDFARHAMLKDMYSKNKDQKKTLHNELKDVAKKITVAKANLNNITTKKNKLATAYIDELIDDNMYQKKLAKIKAEEEQLNKTIAYLTQKQIEDKDKLDNFEAPIFGITDMRTLEKKVLSEDLSPEDAFSLTHRYIYKINLRRLDATNKALEFISTNGIVIRYLLSGLGRGFRIYTNSEIEMYNKPFNEITPEDFNEEVSW